MPIAPTFYSNQLPAICRTLAERALDAVVRYKKHSGIGRATSSDDDVDTLENVFRLLEMYRAHTLSLVNPSGVLGVDPRLAYEIAPKHVSAAATVRVEEKLEDAMREAFGAQVNFDEAIEQLEGVLGTVAYQTGASDQAALKRAETFFGALRSHLTERGMVAVR